MSAKFIKLTSGEEMVADIVDEKDGVVGIKNPTRFIATKEGLGVMPFFPLAKCEDKIIKLDAKYIMLVLDLEDDIYNAYNSQFGSGIVLPTAQQTMKIVTDD